jgi:hypothetical protein
MGRRSRVLPREVCSVAPSWARREAQLTGRIGQKSAEAIVPPRKAGRAEHVETDRSRALDEPGRRRQEG